jgi:hypothetical protein
MTATTRRIAKQESYSHHEVAELYEVSVRTAREMIKSGHFFGGYQAPGRPSLWMVNHEDLMDHARGSWGNFQYVLEKIEGLDAEEMSLIYRRK